MNDPARGAREPPEPARELEHERQRGRHVVGLGHAAQQRALERKQPLETHDRAGIARHAAIADEPAVGRVHRRAAQAQVAELPVGAQRMDDVAKRLARLELRAVTHPVRGIFRRRGTRLGARLAEQQARVGRICLPSRRPPDREAEIGVLLPVIVRADCEHRIERRGLPHRVMRLGRERPGGRGRGLACTASRLTRHPGRHLRPEHRTGEE
jgi:hypothetical protein